MLKILTSADAFMNSQGSVEVTWIPMGYNGYSYFSSTWILGALFLCATIVKVALRRLTEKIPPVMNLIEKLLYSFYPRGIYFIPTDPTLSNCECTNMYMCSSFKLRFIGCDSIQSYSFVSKRFQFRRMIHGEF